LDRFRSCPLLGCSDLLVLEIARKAGICRLAASTGILRGLTVNAVCGALDLWLRRPGRQI